MCASKQLLEYSPKDSQSKYLMNRMTQGKLSEARDFRRDPQDWKQEQRESELRIPRTRTQILSIWTEEQEYLRSIEEAFMTCLRDKLCRETANGV